MEIKELYAAIGGNYDEAARRLSSEAVLKKFVLKFPADPTYANLLKAKAENNVENAFLAAHTLKGVAATLGFITLAEAASVLTEALRPRNAMPSDDFFAPVDRAYALAIENIAKLSA